MFDTAFLLQKKSLIISLNKHLDNKYSFDEIIYKDFDIKGIITKLY